MRPLLLVLAFFFAAIAGLNAYAFNALHKSMNLGISIACGLACIIVVGNGIAMAIIDSRRP